MMRNMKEDIRLPPKWIELNLRKRECTVFISSEQDEEVCQCGRTKSEHVNAVQHHHGAESWTPSLHTQSYATDSYGTMVFEGGHYGHYPNKARYVRLSHDTSPDLVVELMTLVWGVPPPKLLITVRGGNNDFDLTSWLGQLLQTGLIKAAKATNAWILTNGLNKGVAKHIGNAVLKEPSMGVKRGRVVTIGIAPWGVVENRHSLIGHNKERTYSLLEHATSRNVILNPRHCHFLLVDNGSLGKFGGESFFRKRLENYISRLPTSPNRGCDTPIVCVVIEGGFYTLRNIVECLTDEPPIPVVIFNGSGRTSDLVSYIVIEIQRGRQLEHMKPFIYERMKSIYKITDNKQCDGFYSEIETICEKRHLLTVYSPRSADDEGFDVTLLASIFRSQHWTPLQQLSLTLVWDRVDIANHEVFTYGRDWSRENLEHAMMEALVSDRLQFINLLIEHGLNMQTFLTPRRLEALYSIQERSHMKANKQSHLFLDLVKLHGGGHKSKHDHNAELNIFAPVTLHDIGLTMNKIMGHIYKSKYVGFRYGRRLKHELQEYESADSDEELEGTPRFPQPFDDLFIWAVLTKRHSMALLLWPHGPGALAKALVAVKLNKYFGQELVNVDSNTSNEFTSYAMEWETVSYELLDAAFKSDPKMARTLLTMELENWSNQTCLYLAVVANHRMFLGHPCCQTLLADLWMGALNFKNHAELKVILGILFPPSLYFWDYKSIEELRLLPHKERPQDEYLMHEGYGSRHYGLENESLPELSRSRASFTSSIFVDETNKRMHEARREAVERLNRRFSREDLEDPTNAEEDDSNRDRHSERKHQHEHHDRHVDVLDTVTTAKPTEGMKKDKQKRKSSSSSSNSSSSSSTYSDENPQHQTGSTRARHHRRHLREQTSVDSVKVPERKYSLIEQLYKQATTPATKTHVKFDEHDREVVVKRQHKHEAGHSKLHHEHDNVTEDYVKVRGKLATDYDFLTGSFETTKKDLNCWQKFYEFQKAPITNFFRHTIAYIVFSCCLSYTILVPQDHYHVGWVELYVILYLATLGLDIVREFLSIDAYNWSQKVSELKSKVWTMCDLTFIILFMIGVALRFQARSSLLYFRYGMLIYRISSIYWNLRLYKYMGAHKFLGPKLVMMSRMLKHMAYFAIIIFVVLLAFGLAREAIRFPDLEPTWRNMEIAFLEPYVMMFGEVDADSIIQCGDEDQLPCPVGHWVIPLIWIIYMMVANILIVNVLIAVFNGIYSEVDSIALELWLFQRFTFVMEFERKPILPAPFVVFCHLYYISRWIYGKCFACFCEEQLEKKGFELETQVQFGNDHSLKTFLTPAETTLAFDFELDNVDAMLSGAAREENETTNVLRKAGIIGIGTRVHTGFGMNMTEHQVFGPDPSKLETVKGFAQLRTQIKEFGMEVESQRQKMDKLIGLIENQQTELQELRQPESIIKTVAASTTAKDDSAQTTTTHTEPPASHEATTIPNVPKPKPKT